MFAVFAAIFSFLGVGFLVQSWNYHNLELKFAVTSVRVHGVVDHLTESIGTSSSKSTGSARLIVDYHFDVSGGRHGACAIITQDTWNRLRKGDSVPIKYLPDDPAVSRLDLPQEDSSHRAEVWIDLAAGVFLLPIGLALFWNWLKR